MLGLPSQFLIAFGCDVQRAHSVSFSSFSTPKIAPGVEGRQLCAESAELQSHGLLVCAPAGSSVSDMVDSDSQGNYNETLQRDKSRVHNVAGDF
jgi:hypothetical protein